MMSLSEMHGYHKETGNPGRSYWSSMWFNSQLFTVNGGPLKFHLAGYSFTEFHKMVQIIEAYGGSLSRPDASDTFIFCEPDRRAVAEKHDRYDVKYFYDSIVALEPQELMKYKLQVPTNDHVVSDTDGSSYSESDEETHDETQESMDYEVETPIDPSPACKDAEKSTASQHNVTDPEQKNNLTSNDCVDLWSSDREDLNEQGDGSNRCPRSEAEVDACVPQSLSDVDRLNESTMPGPSTTPQTNHQRNDNYDEVNENASAASNATDDDGPSKRYNAYYRDDEFIPPESVRKHYRKKQYNTSQKFSEEDNQVILNWLKERNVMPMYGRKIWKEFVREKVLGDRDISPDTLRGHYIRKLQKHPTYVKYLEDWKTSGSTLAPAYMKRPAYTEEEDRAIIKYLIENNIIHRGKNIKTWVDCLRECKSSLHPTRTAGGLQLHFKISLSIKYAKYTADPSALKKFERMDPSKNVKPQNPEKINPI